MCAYVRVYVCKFCLSHSSFPLLLDESAFTMEDLAGEAAHGMKLAESLSRASRKKLLKVVCMWLLV